MRRVSQTTVSRLLPLLCRRSVGSEQNGTRVEIADDEVVVELLDAEEAAHGQSESEGFCEVVPAGLDPYARAKVLNFIKRAGSAKSSPTSAPSSPSLLSKAEGNLFSIRSFQTFDGAHFEARLALPLPQEYGERVAVGVAPTAKDAECLAAMHAEQIIDALGFHMYSLQSTQRRHAAAARQKGRWAPMPEDGPKSPTCRNPLPLRLGVRACDPDDGVKYTLVSSPKGIALLSLTLTSPSILDQGSIYRIVGYYGAHHEKLPQNMRSFLTNEKKDGKENKSVVVQLRLVVPNECGRPIATGKASDKRTALILACMHAELILDALGVPLHSLEAKQEQHAEECARLGRWAAKPGEELRPSAELPHALKLAESSEQAAGVPAEVAEVVAQSSAITAMGNVTEVASVDPEARNALAAFLGTTEERSFLVDRLGRKSGSTFRCSIALPVPHEYGSRVGIGIGPSEEDAKCLAAMHALHILGTLKLQVFQEPIRQQAFYERMKTGGYVAVSPGTLAAPPDTPSPPPFKLVSARNRGRVAISLSRAEYEEDDQPFEGESEALAREMQKARATVPQSNWSLKPDTADGYILVRTSSDDSTFLHTLQSPRIFDRFAKNKLLDYLERNGKNRQCIVAKRVFVGNKQLWRLSIPVILPKEYGERFAVGEAPSFHEAEILLGMHLELILDTLGLPFYDHSVYQRRHARTAASQGRSAPLPRAKPSDPSTPSPPPLRMEDAASNSTKGARVPAHPDGSPKPTVDTLSPITRAEMDVRAPTRMEHYFKENGWSVLLSKVVRPSMALKHQVTLVMPLPLHGPRTAIGVAHSARDATILCYMHAQRIIDSLDLPLFQSEEKQLRHHRILLDRGMHAPLPNVPPKPMDTPSPPGLRIDAFGEVDCPDPPEAGVACSLQDWTNYISASVQYIDNIWKQQAVVAFEQVHSPRCGVALEDEALAAVEALQVDPRAWQRLRSLCQTSGFPFPRFPNPQSVGTRCNLCFYVEVQVEPTDYYARGVAGGPDAAVNRAAMHYSALLERIIAGQPLPCASPAVPVENTAQVDEPLYCVKSGLYTPLGKAEIVRLCSFAAGNPEPRIVVKTKSVAGASQETTQVALIEFLDGDAKLYGRGESQVLGDAVSHSYTQLFKELTERKPSCMSICKLCEGMQRIDGAIKIGCLRQPWRRFARRRRRFMQRAYLMATVATSVPPNHSSEGAPVRVLQ